MNDLHFDECLTKICYFFTYLLELIVRRSYISFESHGVAFPVRGVMEYGLL